MGSVTISEIASFVDCDFLGDDFIITKVMALESACNGSLCFVNDSVCNININNRTLYLVTKNREIITGSCSYIVTKNPRLLFARIVSHFFIKENPIEISSSAVIGKDVFISDNVSIGSHSFIGDKVQIGRNTIIRNNVSISNDTIIGNNCYIGSGSVIGEIGFGFEQDESNTPIRIPHLGFVRIGDFVEVGSNVVISRGTIGETIIANHAKIDDLVHIAHNCKIGERTFVIGCSEVAGSVEIGSDCWISPNSSIMQKKKIGNKSIVGMGCVVTHDVPENGQVMDVGAISMRQFINFKKIINSKKGEK